MLPDMVQSQDHQQLTIDEITSPFGAQLLELCESELFQNSDVPSTSNNNCCYEERPTYPSDQMNNNEMKTPEPRAITNFSIIFDDATDDQLDNDISASIDFTPSPSFSAPHHHQQYYNSNSNNNNNNQEALNNNIPSTNNQHIINGPPLPQYPPPPPPPLLPYEDECLESYLRLRPSQPLIDQLMPPFLPPPTISTSFSPQTFTPNTGLLLGNELSHQDHLDFQADNASFFLPDNIPRVFNCSTQLQALGNESQHLMHGGSSTNPLASEISSLDDPTFKVGKLSVEERKRKIHRYLKKRNERNFSKKIKYACRKTLADSRPRVRGRFAKNDELGELARTTGSNLEDDVDEDGQCLFSNSIQDHQRKVVVKEEDDLDSADIFAHISGVNSFKCNYPIQSWI
ncbi:CCT motif family protein [Striga hermonthica]|uniref:CCT motif family protein n=1 Tax=Striga hermonthica TaxID=68872 RepID=A0A9N7NQF7_STRHE|nr:CCT motif family protein [Striga hermonthica]